MAEDIMFVVVGHHTRLGHAQRLAAMLDAHLLIDEENHGANWNHLRAIEWAAKQPCRVVVLEDDALPVQGFSKKITDWLARFPEDMLSFYLGSANVGYHWRSWLLPFSVKHESSNCKNGCAVDGISVSRNIGH